MVSAIGVATTIGLLLLSIIWILRDSSADKESRPDIVFAAVGSASVFVYFLVNEVLSTSIRYSTSLLLFLSLGFYGISISYVVERLRQ